MFKTDTIRCIVSLVLASLLPARGQLQNRCGDCWCAPGDGVCPTDTTGIRDTFSDDDSIWGTFQLTNTDAEFLKLQANDGSSDCYPFAESVGPIDRYPSSNFPQCVKPTTTDTTVCGFLFNEADETCAGRRYQVLTYDSAEAARAAGARVTHSGGKENKNPASAYV